MTDIERAAKLMGRSTQFIRIGLQRGLLPIGTAIKNGSKYTYWISPKLFKEFTGYELNEAERNGNI